MTKTTIKQTTKTPSTKPEKAAGRSKPGNRDLAEQLSDMQLVTLAAACQHDDRTIAIPETLEDEAIAAFAASLIALGLAGEAPAERGQPVWRQDQASGQSITLRITDQALTVLGIDEGDAGKGTEDAEMAMGAEKAHGASHMSDAGLRVAGKAAAKAPEAVTEAPGVKATTDNSPTQARRAEPPQPRAGSKQGQLITMLSRDDGASIAEIATALGWLPHTTRAALTGLRHKGYELGREIAGGERGSIYRITAMPIAAQDADGAAMSEAA